MQWIHFGNQFFPIVDVPYVVQLRLSSINGNRMGRSVPSLGLFIYIILLNCNRMLSQDRKLGDTSSTFSLNWDKCIVAPKCIVVFLLHENIGDSSLLILLQSILIVFRSNFNIVTDDERFLMLTLIYRILWNKNI